MGGCGGQRCFREASHPLNQDPKGPAEGVGFLAGRFPFEQLGCAPRPPSLSFFNLPPSFPPLVAEVSGLRVSILGLWVACKGHPGPTASQPQDDMVPLA